LRAGRPPAHDGAVHRSPAPLAIVSVVLVGCGSSGSPSAIDARPQADAGAVTIDAPAATPDAPVSAPDAPAATPDAPVSAPDAPAATPDAPPATPDAQPPDARPPDAAALDARPVDAGSTGQCLPQCFIDINAALITPCVPEPPCTRSAFDLQTFSFAACYANGVKIVNVINFESGTATITFREPYGDTCYSYEIVPTSESSAEVRIRNREGTQLARIVVPDTEQSIQHYYCGNDGPFVVDFDDPACTGEDEEYGETGDDCPESALCMP
jgi:hypothetical protein